MGRTISSLPPISSFGHTAYPTHSANFKPDIRVFHSALTVWYYHLLLTLTLLTQVKSILRTKNVNRGVRAASTISYKMERKKLLFFHLIFLSPFLSAFFGEIFVPRRNRIPREGNYLFWEGEEEQGRKIIQKNEEVKYLVYGKEKNSCVVRIVIYIRNPCVYNPIISSWFLPSFLEAHAQF